MRCLTLSGVFAHFVHGPGPLRVHNKCQSYKLLGAVFLNSPFFLLSSNIWTTRNMKSSIFLTATGAALALANSIDKRAIETDIVVEYYTVTVTGNPPQSTPTQAAPTQAQAAPSEVSSGAKARPFPNSHQPAPVPQVDPEPSVVLVTVTAGTPESTMPPSPPVVTVTAGAPDNTMPPSPPVVTVTAGAPDSTTPPSPPVVTVTAGVPDSTAPPTAPQAAATAADDFQSQALFHHNIHRANHSSPEVTWNDEIAGYAAITAATCHFAHDMNEGNAGYGQNIALYGVSSGALALGETGAIKMAVTNMWYDGEFRAFLPSYYGQTTPDMTNFDTWGHLSQTIWSGSTSIGCAVKFCPAGTAYSNLDSWFSVCNYHPPGNINGLYALNIKSPRGDATVSV
ncbi:CAP domain-containing protein [Xylaria nigripes]|nr:CAP domain-containing protein [Xylaria nigripes]